MQTVSFALCKRPNASGSMADAVERYSSDFLRVSPAIARCIGFFEFLPELTNNNRVTVAII